MTIPISLVTAVAVQTLCQLLKVVVYSLRDRSLSFRYFVSAGGVPSSHSAFVSALTVSVAIRAGVMSEIFAVSAVFSAIVMYDAVRLRGHVQEQAKVINRYLLSESDREPLNEMIGHSLPEVFSGIVIGGGLSAVAALLFG